MAQAKQLPSGMWRRLVRVKGHPIHSITRRTKKECDLAARKVEQDIRDGKLGKAPKKTLVEVFDHYGEKVSPGKAGHQHELLRIEAFKRHFAALPEYGDLTSAQFCEIDTEHVVAWRDMRLAQISEGSVLREINLLRNIFRIAKREWRWTDKEPFEGIRLPRDNPPRTRRPMWQEVRKIVRHLGYRTGEVPSTKSQEVAYAWLIAMRTCLRTLELLRLTDDVVDIDKRVLRVKRKTYHQTREIREVPFTPAAARLFRPLKGWGGPLFTVDAASMDALFRKARTQLMITGLQFRDSRADGATRLVKKGVQLLELARILDHKNLDQLNKTYYRTTAEDIAKGLR
jgi:integrase